MIRYWGRPSTPSLIVNCESGHPGEAQIAVSGTPSQSGQARRGVFQIRPFRHCFVEILRRPPLRRGGFCLAPAIRRGRRGKRRGGGLLGGPVGMFRGLVGAPLSGMASMAVRCAPARGSPGTAVIASVFSFLASAAFPGILRQDEFFCQADLEWDRRHPTPVGPARVMLFPLPRGSGFIAQAFRDSKSAFDPVDPA